MAGSSSGRSAKGSGMVVRAFRAEDAAATSEVMKGAFATFIPAAHQQIVFGGFTPEALAASVPPPGKGGSSQAAIVVEAGGRILGYAQGSCSRFGFGTLGVIGVHPDHLHEGVGSLLMRRMVTFWRRHGMRKVSTSVSAHNGRALQFYLSHGFRPVGYQRDHYLVGMDEVILDLFLERRGRRAS